MPVAKLLGFSRYPHECAGGLFAREDFRGRVEWKCCLGEVPYVDSIGWLSKHVFISSSFGGELRCRIYHREQLRGWVNAREKEGADQQHSGNRKQRSVVVTVLLDDIAKQHRATEPSELAGTVHCSGD